MRKQINITCTECNKTYTRGAAYIKDKIGNTNYICRACKAKKAAKGRGIQKQRTMTCSYCGEERTVSSVYFNELKQKGLSVSCRSCRMLKASSTAANSWRERDDAVSPLNIELMDRLILRGLNNAKIDTINTRS